MRSADGKIVGIVGGRARVRPLLAATSTTFRFARFDDPPCKIIYELREVVGGTEFVMTLDDLPPGTVTSKQMPQGAALILKTLKSLVETGKLPLGTRALYGSSLSSGRSPRRRPESSTGRWLARDLFCSSSSWIGGDHRMAKIIDDAIASMIANLEAKTGQSLDAWIEVARSTGLARHGEILAILKRDHSLSHGYANLVARRFLQFENDEPTASIDLVSALFEGSKAGLKPLYDAVVAVALDFAGDVEVDPKKSYVSIRRKKQFALVVPSTSQRLDLGLNLKGVEPVGRLEASGSFNAMCSHRVRLGSEADLDAEARAWLRKAYDAS